MSQRPENLPDLLADAGLRLKSLTPGHSEKLLCPRCGGGKTREKSLSVTVDDDGGGAVFQCHRGTCGWQGGGRVGSSAGIERERPIARPEPHTAAQKENRPDWLHRFFADRRIGPKTLNDLGIYATTRWFPDPVGEAPSIVFPYVWRGEVVNRKYRPHPAKNPMLQERDALPTLFNIDALGDAPEEIVWVEGECLPPDSTVLTERRGWVAIGDLRPGEPVAQWDKGTISFVRPTAYIRRPHAGPLVEWSGRGFALRTTPDHAIVRQTRSGLLKPTPAWAMTPDTRYVIPRAGICEGIGLKLTDAEIQLALAVSADAATDERKNGSRYARFGLKKGRKIVRLRYVLAACGIVASDTAIADGYQSICFPLPDWVPGRLLPWEWIGCVTLAQRKFILGELTHWDGNRVPDRDQTEYSTIHAWNAEWVQALAHLSGIVSSLIHRSNAFGEWTKVSLLHGKRHTGTQFLTRRDEPYNGDVFCVSVPSGMLMVRQREVITVVGNCDVAALWECGCHNVVTLKDGAPARVGQGDNKRFEALRTHADVLSKAKRIILAGDTDAPGLALREELARRLGRHRCRIAEWPRGCKDAGDTLVEHGPDGVLGILAASEPYPIEGLRSTYGGRLLALRDQPPPATMTTGTFASDAQFKLPAEGRLIVVTGWPSSGKTAWTRFVMVHTARHHDRRWCVFSPEMQPWEQFIAMCAEVVAGKPFWPVSVASGRERMTVPEVMRAEAWLTDRVVMMVNDSEDEPPTLEWILEHARLAILRDGITDLLIDPWNEIDHQRGTMSETDYVGRSLQRLKSFALRHGCNIWLIAHPAKPIQLRPGEARGPAGPYDISGSAHFVNKSDMGFTIHSLEGGKSNVSVWKSRFRRWALRGAMVVLDYDDMTGRYSSPGEKDHEEA